MLLGVPQEENVWAVPVRRHQGVAEVNLPVFAYGRHVDYLVYLQSYSVT